MTSDRWWWAQKAQQLRFTQLDSARRQAETWRTGLTSVTALLSAVLVIMGRDTVKAIAMPYQLIVVLLFGAALAALVIATLLAIRAASGSPGDECLLTGEDVERWTQDEVQRVYQLIRNATIFTVVGIWALAAGLGTSWLAPAGSSARPTVLLQSRQGQYCGQLLQIGSGVIEVGTPDGYYLMPLSSVVRVNIVASCKHE